MSLAGSGGPSAGRTRRDLGRRGEDLAAEHLLRRGFDVVARNVRTRHGEIDLIAFDGRTLAFVEVKTLRVNRDARGEEGARPLDWLRHRQRARLRRLATAWLAEQGPGRPAAQTIRFDAEGVTVGRRGGLVRLDHLEGAF